MSYTDRIIVLVDMDCFYCQVEEELDPNLKGKPVAVVQYNEWRGGGIIAVNYPAKEKGVTRYMRGNDAKRMCPEIMLVKVPQVRGKADLTKYREAGKRVAEVLKMFTPLLERASVDEAYMDITDAVNKRINTDFEKITSENMKNTYVVGWDMEDFLYNIHRNSEYIESNCKLAMGGLIAEEIRAEVYKKTGYKCSAGIAHNKILAKVVCGLHKPNKQTILPQESLAELYKDLPIHKIHGLGGKFGNTLSETFNITKMGELQQFSERAFAEKFDDKSANWLYNIARGIDLEPVTVRLLSKSIGCSKQFPGKSALVTYESIMHWMNELTSEIMVRLEKDLLENNRKAKHMIISFAQRTNNKEVSSSRTIPLNNYDKTKMAQAGIDTIKRYCLKSDGSYNITFLGLSVGNFEKNRKIVNITTLFKNIKDLNNDIKTFDNGNSVLSETKFLETSKLIDIENINVSKILPDKDEIDTIASGCNTLKETINTESSCVEDENVSIYSATTEELNEDTKSLIYYEDIYPESTASQPIFEDQYSENLITHNVNALNNLENSKNTSLSEKFGCPNNIKKPSTSSFFSNYFENFNTGNSPIQRNFDTSKILEESRTEIEYSTESINSDEILLEKVSKENEFKSQTHNQEDIEEDYFIPKETCPECNKKILADVFPSHMDYHYALKIVRDEAHLYKQVPNTVSPKNVKTEKKTGFPVTKSTKRKLKETQETKPILTFLQKDELNEGNSEMCSECRKRIKLEDVVSHADYHAAKKLHLELNSHCSPIPKSTDNYINLKNKKIMRNIDTFFKS